jgi:NAD(P)-dependent dehydrogenase (short-subunit alcohol dehydrogenase family)
MDFTSKTVLVTGSSRGIGRAAAQTFLDCGARVAVNGRTADSTAAGIAALGGDERLVAAPGDVGTVAGCEAVVATALEALGGLDILVNNAGVGPVGPIEDCDEAMWDETLDVNLKGTFFCCRAALPTLRASRGNIVNVASDAGLMGDVNLSVYCASKGGVVNLTRALALELAPGVRVNCVCPGFIATDMVRDEIEEADNPAAREQALIDYTPMKRIASPEEIGRAIAYLASDDARFVTGAAFQIDGGTTAGR